MAARGRDPRRERDAIGGPGAVRTCSHRILAPPTSRGARRVISRRERDLQPRAAAFLAQAPQSAPGSVGHQLRPDFRAVLVEQRARAQQHADGAATAGLTRIVELNVAALDAVLTDETTSQRDQTPTSRSTFASSERRPRSCGARLAILNVDTGIVRERHLPVVHLEHERC